MSPSEVNPELKASDLQNNDQGVSQSTFEVNSKTPDNVEVVNLKAYPTLNMEGDTLSEEEVASAFTGEPIKDAGTTDKNKQSESEAVEAQKTSDVTGIDTNAKLEEKGKTKKTKKKFSKKNKIALLVSGWIALLGVGAGAAFLLKPAPEIIHTDAIVEAYKYSEQDTEKNIETVDDLNYYGYYAPNPIVFNRLSDGKYKGAYVISGLKDKSVEEIINNQIKEAASRLYDVSPERDGVNMEITANYYNILSFTISQYNYETGRYQYEYFTFDLNTGNELSFDNLFPSNINLSSLLFKSFYDGLSTDIQFARLGAQKRLSAESHFPDPSQCMAQYCPYPGETYDSLRELIANYDAQLANIEETVANSLQSYLSGDKRFYLNSYGPTFILADGSTVGMELGDNIRYAVYLKNYRSSDSIFDSGILPESNPFFTEIPDPNVNYINEETETYLFDYAENLFEEDISPSIRQSFREQVKNRGISIPGDVSKFRHILASGHVTEWKNIRTGQVNLCVYETDKSYYNSTYRKAVVDGKTQFIWFADSQQPARIGHYDTDKVVPLSIDGGSAGCQQINAAVTSSGELVESVDGILIDPSNSELGWEDYLKQIVYQKICYRSWDQKCYSDEEKQSQELLYSFSGGASITVKLKDNSETGSIYLWSVDLSDIPTQYINPAILVDHS